MNIALLNSTPVVAKLVERMAEKRGDLLSEGPMRDGRAADIVIVDDSFADRYDAAAAKQLGTFTLFIGSRFETMPQGFDAVLAKPFLPDELDKALGDAELSISASVERSDLFDADEAAASWGEEPAENTEVSVFDRTEIDELKQLLDAVEQDESPEETVRQLEAAMQQLGVRDWDEHEVLYDADAALPEGDEPTEDAETSFEDIDLHARGVEALQDLMAILSDESVARAFKMIGVRVDISFGEKA
jgi:uncharacterized membrane protein